MKRTNKKGFTIVELVIVIAVIAILAAVLIPNISRLVRKANESADIQAVRQMNTILSTYVDGSVKTVADAVKVLDEADISLENYKALHKDRYFYFVLDKDGRGMIIYADASNKVLYPENANIAANAQWMSLSGDIPTDDNYTVASDGTVTIDSGAKLAHLIESKKNTSEALTIELSGNVDLKGAAVDFGATTASIIIKGGTLSGLRCDDNTVSPTSGEFANHSYGFGLFGNIKSGTVKLEDVVISNLVVGNSLGNHEKGANTTGLIAGYIASGATLEMNNVTFKNCVVNGYQKVGGIVGQLHGSLVMNNVKFEDTSINGYVEVAKIAGTVMGEKAVLTVNDGCDFSGITTTCLHSTQIKLSQISGSVNGNLTNTFDIFEGVFYMWGGVTSDWAWYVGTNSGKTVTVNGASYTFNGLTDTASSNFVQGKPVND